MPQFEDRKNLFDHPKLAPDGLPTAEVRRIYGQNGLPISEVRGSFGQIVDGFSFLHKCNIIHQDLKDKNIICHRHGNAQLIDFGSAAYVREGSKFEMFLGTLDFVAPEVLKGIPNCGKEIDIYGHWG